MKLVYAHLSAHHKRIINDYDKTVTQMDMSFKIELVWDGVIFTSILFFLIDSNAFSDCKV